ncbi:hypothetical protein [Legionella tunisiensis]|uniref:hypothetical protein n=1 Tax=Legionella tunisiensis TaxID=1034944 RepID=UPI000365722A|nr:hypothetical protein [Legionella tunisiensis]
MSIKLYIGFKPYFSITELSASELKTVKDLIKQSLGDYYKQDLALYADMYKSESISLLVEYVSQEDGMWLVEFREQATINKRAWVNPQDPKDILVVTYEEDTLVLTP